MDHATIGSGPHSLGFAIEDLRARWMEIVALGALLAALGVVALCFTLPSTIATVALNGIFLMIAGVAEIGVGARAKNWARVFLWMVGGAIYVFAGLICFLNPIFASLILTLALGAGLIATGVVRALLAFSQPSGASRATMLLAAIATFLLGWVIVVHWPWNSVHVLGILLGLELVIHGIGWASFGIGLRPRR